MTNLTINFTGDTLLSWVLLIAIAAILFLLRTSHNRWLEFALAWTLLLIGTTHAMITQSSVTTLMQFSAPATAWVFPLAVALMLRCVIETTTIIMWPGVGFAVCLAAAGLLCFDGLPAGLLMTLAIIVMMVALHPWARTYGWCILGKPLGGMVTATTVGFTNPIMLIPLAFLSVTLMTRLLPENCYETHEPEEEPQPATAAPPTLMAANAFNRWRRRQLDDNYTRLMVDTITIKIGDTYQQVYVVAGVDMAGVEQAMGIWLDAENVWDDMRTHLGQRGVTHIPAISCPDDARLRAALTRTWPQATVLPDNPTPRSQTRMRTMRQVARRNPADTAAAMMDTLWVALYTHEMRVPTGRAS